LLGQGKTTAEEIFGQVGIIVSTGGTNEEVLRAYIKMADREDCRVEARSLFEWMTIIKDFEMKR
jgi:hypothetical protein